MKNKTITQLILAASLFLFSQAGFSTTIGFNDAYDPSHWTFNAPANGGSVNTSGTPNSISLTSSWAGNFNTWELATYTFAATEEADISFHWDYNTTDGAGSLYDRFGWILNGTLHQLTYCAPCLQGPANNNNHIWGDTSVQVVAGDVFGYYFHSDGYYGTATTVVSNFAATTPPPTIPEPGTAILFIGGIMGLLYRRKQGLRLSPMSA